VSEIERIEPVTSATLQVDSPSDWDIVSEVIYDPSHSWWQEKPEMIQLLQSAFVPSATPFSLQVNGKNVSDRRKIDLEENRTGMEIIIKTIFKKNYVFI